MPKKGTKEITLFNGKRRKIQFKAGAVVWLDAKGSKHTRLKLQMPLSNENMLAFPDFVSVAFAAMQKDTSADDYHGYDAYMEGMAVCFYVTDKSKEKIVRLTGCELQKFHLQKKGSGDKAVVFLNFECDVLGHKELYDYMWDHHAAIAYVDFDYNQEDIPFKAASDDDHAEDGDDEGDDDEDDDDEDGDELEGQAARATAHATRTSAATALAADHTAVTSPKAVAEAKKKMQLM